MYTAYLYIQILKIDIKNSNIDTVDISETAAEIHQRVILKKSDQLDRIKMINRPSINIWIKVIDDIELMFEYSNV